MRIRGNSQSWIDMQIHNESLVNSSSYRSDMQALASSKLAFCVLMPYAADNYIVMHTPSCKGQNTRQFSCLISLTG